MSDFKRQIESNPIPQDEEAFQQENDKFDLGRANQELQDAIPSNVDEETRRKLRLKRDEAALNVVVPDTRFPELAKEAMLKKYSDDLTAEELRKHLKKQS